MLPSAHVEEAVTERDDYERKSGNFISSTDTPEIRQVRYGTPRPDQEEIINLAREQNDRQIHFFYDTTGNHGKSWLTIHLWERGKGFVVPRSDATAGKLSAYICSGYQGEEFIVIDIPRAAITDRGMYECLEDTKDGLVFDHRYTARTRNIRGTKLIVFTNHPIDPYALSRDRYKAYRYAIGGWIECSHEDLKRMWAENKEIKKKKGKK